ncbi:hypothetical protein ASC64_19225 [Nocardioides sp. Root122]|uniref:hypothetical protein n=1 Tax=Nocardioides cavernae TaxID=1921566 RepID=UPI000702DF26|nr:hypothetical protein [Nocardioides cavernae]KQV72780.1 hypothetical protein ASC64_19225 [Nocardioides sp. Root122]MCK9825334.1 hypothetical protein [Nocardioides cavernae]
MTAREAALAKRMEEAQAILAAADRDAAADERERDLDRAKMVAPPDAGDYGHDWPERRCAAADREHSKDDRAASHDDRIHLTEGSDPDDA